MNIHLDEPLGKSEKIRLRKHIIQKFSLEKNGHINTSSYLRGLVLMCGIAGLVPIPTRFQKSPSPLEVLEAMTDRLAHRGPDSNGKWHDADRNIYFGHRRLSIIDLSTNAIQPMHSGERQVHNLF